MSSSSEATKVLGVGQSRGRNKHAMTVSRRTLFSTYSQEKEYVGTTQIGALKGSPFPDSLCRDLGSN